MRVKVISEIPTARGILPVGKILEISDAIMIKLAGKVVPVCAEMPPVPSPAVWPPTPKAWLTSSGELRTTGVFEDLAGEIIRMTPDNMQLQAKLLRECCGAYSGPQWNYLVGDWNERSATMQNDGKLSRDEAEIQAADMLRLTAFISELRGLT